MNANVLESPTDYVKWIHNFNFSPSVQNPGGILNASLSISLVNYALSGKDEHGNEYGDRDHEEDQDHKDEYVDGKLKERNKKQVSDGNGGTKDDRREHSIDLGCLYTNNTLATNALIRLEGNSAWFNIPSINGDSDFEVVLTKLYDGIFAVEIKSTMSDFILEWSKLDIEYCSAAPVPEPSTFILLGAGLIGAGLIRRRSSK
ncbi:MAG TPA: PEP-CTERM sorting domain-containing protein [Desulfuromonadales bacterium]|nr:PEP-CTERM sorting domain-containing protein [Desulfuromonadales bacterium]